MDVNYPYLVEDIEVGKIVIVDNGLLRMRAIEKRHNELVCEVLTPGPMGSRRHINLPGVDVKLPALTEKDYADIELAFECQMDFIAMSFVRRAADIELLRERIKARSSNIRIVAKIEDQMAVRNLEEIIAACDGLMIARGDLGIEVPYEELPIIQRRAVNLCLEAVKPVIVATHLLESMITNPSPTRAGNHRTSPTPSSSMRTPSCFRARRRRGKYPMECVEIMDRIARRIEQGKTVTTFVNTVASNSPREHLNATAVLPGQRHGKRGHLRLHPFGPDGAIHRGSAAPVRAHLRLHAEPRCLPQPVAALRHPLARDRIPQRPERKSHAHAGAAAGARLYAPRRFHRGRVGSRRGKRNLARHPRPYA